MNLLDQLVYFYKNYEPFQNDRLNDEDIRIYFRVMMNEGRLITIMREGELAGYCDFARLTYEQFGEVILTDYISPEINHPYGNIVFVITIVVEPFFRKEGIVKEIKKELTARNPEAYFFAGKRQGKRYKPIVVLKARKIKVFNGDL